VIFVNTGAGRLPRCAAGDGTRFRPVADSTRGRVAVRAIGSAVGLSLRVTTATGPRSGIPCLCPVGLTGAGTNLSDPSGLCTARFNIQQFYALPTLYLCVLCGSENKQLFFFLHPTFCISFVYAIIAKFHMSYYYISQLRVTTCYFLSHSTMAALSISETCSC